MKTKEEIEILRADALAGNAGAQNDLGCAYSSGDGVVKNLKEAFIWFERSAKQGNKYGQYNVGRYYQYGFGTPKNIQLAIEWYEKAAEQGFGQAANMLGEIYEKGIKNVIGPNIQKNQREAYYWYKIGATKEDSLAKYNLARCYELGIGIPVDLNLALQLYALCGREESVIEDKWNNILKSFNPTQSAMIRALNMFNQNPFRVLGVYSNSTTKEIRAIKSQIDALLMVGKEIEVQNDHLIPSNIKDNIDICNNNKEYAQTILNNLKSNINIEKFLKPISKISKSNTKLYESFKVRTINSKIRIYESTLSSSETSLDSWLKIKENEPDWGMLPVRNTETIDDAVRNISSDESRLKYALFWFCNITMNDDKCLNLLKERKWEEACDLWEDEEESFSSLINLSVMNWVDSNDDLAISRVLTIIHNDKFRQEFLTAVTSNRRDLSENDLSHIFWDVIFELPDTPYSSLDFFHKIIEGNTDYYHVKQTITENDIIYIKDKCFKKLKKSIDETIQKIDSLQDNLSIKYEAFNQLISVAIEDLKWIKRFFGKDYYRYRLLCDDIANRLLAFAIHYNNDKIDDWSAPQKALSIATSAMNIAVDENMRERCKQNVDIFKRNKQILSTDKLLEAIDKIFKEVDEKSVTLSQAEKIETDVEMFLGCIKTENGKESDLYKNVSDNAVNAILNVIIAICNRDKDASTAISASGLLKKLKNMDMSSETRSRLERNISIISNNMVAAMRRGNLGDLGGSGKTYSKEENTTRRIHKALATVCSIAAFALMWYYMSWNNNLQYFMETMPLWGYICIIFMVLIALFPIIMWGLEFQKDPLNTRLYWLDNSVESLYNLSNDIMRAGVQGRKTYSWPFAIPFQLLGIAIWILSFPIKGIAKLAAMIK